MTINFHDSSNQSTYASRSAEDRWIQTIQRYVDTKGKTILDLGCGGGIYSKVLANSGAKQVMAMDFSAEMLKGAQGYCQGIDNITFKQGSALDSGLDDEHFDIMLERALIHHIVDLQSCFQEANRVLKNKGMYIIQDRTPEDCSLPGSSTHIRGYFFEKYPQLMESEIKRRYASEQVISTLQQTGFEQIQEIPYWETREVHEDMDHLKRDLLSRTGRSILHELTDDELESLVAHIEQQVGQVGPIVEKDRWTVWIAQKS